MKIGSAFSQKLPSILISAVIAAMLAMIVGTSAFDILSYGLRRQLFTFALLWGCLGIFFYILLTRLLAHTNILLAPSTLGFSSGLQKTFLAVFFLFPITLILYQQFVEFLQLLGTGQSSDFIGWLPPGANTRTFFIQAFGLCCAFLWALILAGRKPSVRNFFNHLSDFWYILFILLCSLAIRLPIIYSINTQPVSDFGIINADALALAEGGRPTHMYVATHVVVTMVYSFVYNIFGSDLNVLKMFHAVVYGIAGIFLYAAGKMIFESKLWAATAAVLLVGLPSLAVYSNVLTPEHLFILLECALVFATAHLFKNRRVEPKTGDPPTMQFLVWSMMIGFLMGLMGMFRPFSELFLAAFIITLLFFTRGLKAIAISLLCVLIAFWMVRDIPAKIATHYQNQFSSIRPCNLLVGMNFDAAGQYNAEDVELCSQLRSKIPNETLFAKTVMGIVWERFQQQQKEFIPFVDEKFAILWTNSNGILFWTVQQVNGGDPNSILEAVQKVNLIDFAIMFLITIICAIGTALAFFRDVKPVPLFCLLTFFGFNMMEIPFELQTRYRTVVMPLIIFFACWTFAALQASPNKSSQLVIPSQETSHKPV